MEPFFRLNNLIKVWHEELEVYYYEAVYTSGEDLSMTIIINPDSMNTIMISGTRNQIMDHG